MICERCGEKKYNNSSSLCCACKLKRGDYTEIQAKRVLDKYMIVPYKG